MYTRPRPRVFLFVTVLYSIMCLHSRRTPYLAPCSLITMYTKTRSICTRLHIGSPVREKLLCGPRVLHDRPLLPYIHPIHTRSTLQVKSVGGGVPRTARSMPRYAPFCPFMQNHPRVVLFLQQFLQFLQTTPTQPPHRPHTVPTARSLKHPYVTLRHTGSPTAPCR